MIDQVHQDYEDDDAVDDDDDDDDDAHHVSLTGVCMGGEDETSDIGFRPRPRGRDCNIDIIIITTRAGQF